jgi:cell division protein FtsI/penicillin-binding protein 2
MAGQPDSHAWRRTISGRLTLLGVLLGAWTVVIEGRLVDLQVYRHEELAGKARGQQILTTPVPARRGDFLDRRGRVLATSVEGESVYAVPNLLHGRERQVADQLCAALADCAPDEAARLADRLGRESEFWSVRRQVSPEQARRVAALGIDGVVVRTEPHRYYPNRELAAHALGYVGTDQKGLAGLEATFDALVRGRPGFMVAQRDGQRRPQVFSRVGDAPVAGATLELTIDGFLQHLAEKELRAGVAEHRAAGGSVVIMDPMTGEILALANDPSFNPNAVALADESALRNRAVQDLYEPGSTFKIVTASAALEERVFTPTELIDTGDGTLTMASRVVRDTAAHGTLSFTDAIVLSSNVGAIKIGLQVGAQRLGRYVQRFGFGTRLSPDFPAENAGIVWDPSQWSVSTLMSVSMGYEIGVTPLQMAAAASAVANGGELLQPRVLRAVIEGNRRTVVPRKVIRRAIAPETAAELLSIMEAVVERGTARSARLADYTVAGKTGTARKLVNGRYSTTDYYASFVGFVPSRSPALTIMVMIDAPHGPDHLIFGGAVAAPICQRIADAALRYLAVPPTINALPPVLVARPGDVAPVNVAGPAVPLTILPASAPPGQVVVPDLRGLSGREALRILARLGLGAKLTGRGVVVDQNPAPGGPLEQGASCRVELGRPVHAGFRP